jgi:hypothetical protein
MNPKLKLKKTKQTSNVKQFTDKATSASGRDRQRAVMSECICIQSIDCGVQI